MYVPQLCCPLVAWLFTDLSSMKKVLGPYASGSSSAYSCGVSVSQRTSMSVNGLSSQSTSRMTTPSSSSSSGQSTVRNLQSRFLASSPIA